MILRLTIAFLHLLMLCLGFYAVWSRAEALKKLREISGLEEVFRADNLWGIAAAYPVVCNCCSTRSLVLTKFLFFYHKGHKGLSRRTQRVFSFVLLCVNL